MVEDARKLVAWATAFLDDITKDPDEERTITSNQAAALLRAISPPARVEAALETLKHRIDIRLNDHLVEMKPDYDDSIVGFNEAWDVVRALFAESLAAARGKPEADENALNAVWREIYDACAKANGATGFKLFKQAIEAARYE